jgi:hypothetical protein
MNSGRRLLAGEGGGLALSLVTVDVARGIAAKLARQDQNIEARRAGGRLSDCPIARSVRSRRSAGYPLGHPQCVEVIR